MEDIRFYDFGFNLLRVLPPGGSGIGYISINATIELCSNGAVEIVFIDNELKEIIEENPDNILVTWGGVQGFVTGYKSEGSQTRLLGMTLNGLLHRVIVPALTETNAGPETVVRNQISAQAAWLKLGAVSGIEDSRTLSTDSYMHADEFANELLSPVHCGYRVYADIKNKDWYFECIKGEALPLILSVDNLNAYNMETTYSNKNRCFGGWYKKEQAEGDPIWTYITTDKEKTGIYKIDTILSSTTAEEARKELEKKKAEYEISAKTRNVSYGVDYRLGDVVRVQNNNTAKRKQVTGVQIWQEGLEHGEQPVMDNYEEE